jgi:hypothetical protein
MSEASDRPGKRWPIILGAAGFVAGFVGPIVFVPDANQGPMVGIFISGPAGVVLGLLLLGFCTVFQVSARKQWKLLWTTTALGVLGILLAVQPQPQRQGLIFTALVTGCSTPIESEAQILEYWNKRVAEVTWHAPRPGWQQDMRTALRTAPGVLVQVRTRAERIVMMNRKPWNRGKLFATEKAPAAETRDYYGPRATCDEFPEGREFTAFQDYLPDDRVQPPAAWPPREIEHFIREAVFSEVPPRFAAFR